MEKTLENIRKDIIKKMENIGMYNDSYLITIDTLARAIFDYHKAIKLYEDTGGNLVISHTIRNGAVNLVKNPIYLSIEKLRSDIFSFSKELGLTPNTKKGDNAGDEAGKKLLEFLNK